MHLSSTLAIILNAFLVPTLAITPYAPGLDVESGAPDQPGAGLSPNPCPLLTLTLTLTFAVTLAPTST